jgi:hypothetical protein
MPWSVQNDGSARAGVDPRYILVDIDFLREGDGFLVSVDVLLVVEPLDPGRKEATLLCFFAVFKVCVELCRRGGGIAVDSSPTVACLKSSQNVHSPSRSPFAIFLLASINMSLSTPGSVDSAIVPTTLVPSTVRSGVVAARDSDMGRGGALPS